MNRTTPTKVLVHVLAPAAMLGLLLFAAFMPSAVLASAPTANDIVLTGILDGPLPGGTPKAIELCVVNDIADLSLYSITSANNGAMGDPDDPEFTFPARSVSAGTFIYIASEVDNFNAFLGRTPDYTSSIANNNGDDTIILYENVGGTNVIRDLIGEEGVDANAGDPAEPWWHEDGWMYRDGGAGPSATFDMAEWTNPGVDALAGATTNGTADTPFPMMSYSGCSQVLAVGLSGISAGQPIGVATSLAAAFMGLVVLTGVATRKQD